jgi:membrane protease subunit HflK
MPWNNQGNTPNGPDKSGPQTGPWGGSPKSANDDGAGKPPPPRRPTGGGSGGNGSGGGSRPPEFDDFMRRLHGMLPTGWDEGNLFSLAAAIILGLWLMSGFYRVQPDEQAIPMVFGKATLNPLGPGLHYNWPTPIGSVVLSRTGSENRIEVGFSSAAGHTGTGAHPESLMLTGDENIIDIKFVVLWKINDPLKYEFNIREPEHLITRAAESAIREVVGETPIQAALTEGREEIASKTRVALQKMLDEYQAGVTVNGIELQAVSPPEKVVDAFNDVQRARSEAETLRNQAEAYRNNILPRAEGEAAKKRQDAIGYQAQVVNQAKGDASRFTSVLQSYLESKEIT